MSHTLSTWLGEGAHHLPEERKRDNRLVEPPCRHEVKPVGVGSIVPPGSLRGRREGLVSPKFSQPVLQPATA